MDRNTLDSSPDEDPAWRPQPGEVLPGLSNYILERRLGTEQYGELWQVQDNGTPRFFWILDNSKHDQEQWRIADFETLRDILSKQPGIVGYRSWYLDRKPALVEQASVTRYMPLPEWLSRGDVPLGLRLEILAQACDAIAAAQAASVLHRALTPARILVDETSGSPRALVDGFALAPCTPSASDYVSPERLSGEPATCHGDVYSLGVILYQLIIGDFSTPFDDGWERHIDNDLLRDDIRRAVNTSPTERLTDPRLIAQRLRALDDRARRQRQAAQRARWRLLFKPAMAALILVNVLLGVQVVHLFAEASRVTPRDVTAKRMTDMVEGVFYAAADPDALSSGKYRSAADLLEEGTHELMPALDAKMKADLKDAVGRAYTQWGAYDKAWAALSESYQLRQSNYPAPHPRLAESLASIGTLHLRQGKIDEAEQTLMRALVLFEETRSTRQNFHAALAKQALAEVRISQERIDEAETLLQEALDIWRATNKAEGISYAQELQRLADFNSRYGSRNKARELYKDILDLIENDRRQAPYADTIRVQIATLTSDQE